jgi:hypothetical protein
MVGVIIGVAAFWTTMLVAFIVVAETAQGRK